MITKTGDCPFPPFGKGNRPFFRYSAASHAQLPPKRSLELKQEAPKHPDLLRAQVARVWMIVCFLQIHQKFRV